jgi:hypothetical protein
MGFGEDLARVFNKRIGNRPPKELRKKIPQIPNFFFNSFFFSNCFQKKYYS